MRAFATVSLGAGVPVLVGALAAFIALSVAALAGCGNEYHPEYHPETAVSYSQNVTYPVNVYESGPVSPAAPGHAANDGSRVLVLQTTHLERPAEVVGVVDQHEEMGHQDAALAALKRKAAAIGADAIVGVEFHHGEAEGEPTHLSGLAVRFIDRPY